MVHIFTAQERNVALACAKIQTQITEYIAQPYNREYITTVVQAQTTVTPLPGSIDISVVCTVIFSWEVKDNGS